MMTVISIRTTRSAFIRNAASETGAFFIRNKKGAIISGVTVVAAAAVIAGSTVFAINSVNAGLHITGAPVAVATGTPTPTASAQTPTATAQAKSAWELEQAAKANYILPDGTTVPIPADQPLPAPVVAAIQAAGNPAVKLLQGSWNPDTHSAQVSAYVSTLKAEEEKIHRKIIPVSFGFDGMAGRNVWAVGADAAGSLPTFDDEAAAVAAAQSWVDANGGSTKYTVITFAG